jgi:hypothetical protein
MQKEEVFRQADRACSESYRHFVQSCQMRASHVFLSLTLKLSKQTTSCRLPIYRQRWGIHLKRVVLTTLITCSAQEFHLRADLPAQRAVQRNKQPLNLLPLVALFVWATNFRDRFLGQLFRSLPRAKRLFWVLPSLN